MINRKEKRCLILLLFLIIFIFCGFKSGLKNVQGYFKSIKSNNIAWIEVKDKLKTETFTNLVDPNENDKLIKLFHKEWKNIKLGKLPIDSNHTTFLVITMLTNDKITFVISDKGCWFYYPFKTSNKYNCYKIEQKDMDVYLKKMLNKYSSIGNLTYSNRYVPKMSDIEAVYIGGGRTYLFGISVLDLRDNYNRKHISDILNELQKAPIMKKDKYDVPRAAAGGGLSLFRILLKNGNSYSIEPAYNDLNSVYFNNYKIYAPITIKSLFSGNDIMKFKKIPCRSINEFLLHQQAYLDMKAIPKNVEYLNSSYYTTFLIDKRNVGKLIGITSDDSNYKVYKLNNESTESAIALKVSETPEVLIMAQKSN